MSWRKFKILGTLRVGRFNVEHRRSTFTNAPNSEYYEVKGLRIGLRFHQRRPPTANEIAEAIANASR